MDFSSCVPKLMLGAVAASSIIAGGSIAIAQQVKGTLGAPIATTSVPL